MGSDHEAEIRSLAVRARSPGAERCSSVLPTGRGGLSCWRKTRPGTSDHNYIGTEHILLGLLREGDGVAAKALSSLGISLDAVRHQVEEIIGRGQQPAASGHIPFTPRAKKVLELSLREALQLGHTYIGTEHILLGLIREGDGVAAQVLLKPRALTSTGRASGSSRS